MNPGLRSPMNPHLPRSTNLLNSLCGRLRTARGAQLRDGEVAKTMRISGSTLSNWLSGTRPPQQIEALLLLLDEFSPAELIAVLEQVKVQAAH